jgi:predicted acylesterase/phospholipase RssA
VSSGSFIAAGLATQLTSAQMCRILISSEPVDGHRAPDVFLKPALGEYIGRSLSLPELLANALARLFVHPSDTGVLEFFSGLGRALPTGVFDNECINDFLTRLFNTQGLTNDFRELTHKLYVVAVDLDTAEIVRFGAGGFDHIPISKAVQASSALPGLYPPVKIDGRYYVDGTLRRTVHASIALDEGAGLVLCVNPLVPFNADLAAQYGKPKHRKLVKEGLPVILSQTFRTLIYSRMDVGFARYMSDSRYKYADILVFEPNRDQSELFFTNAFSYANRSKLCELAYQTTRQDLLVHRQTLEPIFLRHGIRMRREVLEDKTRTFSTGMEAKALPLKPALPVAQVTQRLKVALDRLEDWCDWQNNRGTTR